MLRIDKIQPLIDVSRMVSAGSRLCWMALQMNEDDQLGTTLASKPPEDGKKLPVPVKSVMKIRPSQKYGMDARNCVAGRMPSTQLPRRHPAKTPSDVPMMNAITVVVPTSATVHGRLCLSTSVTGVGKNVNDRPRSPWNS